MKKIFIALSIVVTTLVLVACNINYDLIIYLPNDYMNEDVVKSFEQEYGVKVGIINFNSNEVALKQIKENPSSYDIIIPSDYAMEELADLDLIDVIDWSKIENMSKADLTTDMVTYLEELKTDGFDVLNYSIPYFWGSIGLMYDNTVAGLETRVEAEGWDILADQSLKTMLYDSSRDSFMIGLAHGGKTLSEATQSDIDAARDWLISTKGPNTSIKSDQILDETIGGSTPYDVAVVYSGDATYILQENESYSYHIPEFSNVWIDGMTVAKNSQNKDLAYKFMDWFSLFDNQLENTFEIAYTPVRQDVLEEVLLDEYYLDPRVRETFLVEGIVDFEFFRYDQDLFLMIDNAWIDVKTN